MCEADAPKRPKRKRTYCNVGVQTGSDETDLNAIQQTKFINNFESNEVKSNPVDALEEESSSESEEESCSESEEENSVENIMQNDEIHNSNRHTDKGEQKLEVNFTQDDTKTSSDEELNNRKEKEIKCENSIKTEHQSEGIKLKKVSKPKLSRGERFKLKLRTISVANLPPGTKPTSVRKFLKKYGTIEDFSETNENDTFNFRFEEQRNAWKAVTELNGLLYKGHHLMVNLTAGTCICDPRKTIRVKMPPDVSHDELWAAFESLCGPVSAISLPVQDELRNKGYAYIEFRFADLKKVTLNMKTVIIKNHVIEVTDDIPLEANKTFTKSKWSTDSQSRNQYKLDKHAKLGHFRDQTTRRNYMLEKAKMKGGKAFYGSGIQGRAATTFHPDNQGCRNTTGAYQRINSTQSPGENQVPRNNYITGNARMTWIRPNQRFTGFKN